MGFGRRIDRRPKLVRQLINPSINIHKIAKLRVDVCGYGYGCINANVAVVASVNGNGYGADCVNTHEKIFYTY